MIVTRRLSWILSAIALVTLGIPNNSARAEDAGCETCTPCVCAESLSKMSFAELECLYRGLPASEMPKGYYRGTVLWDKSGLGRTVSTCLTRIVWRGKWICPESATMLNSVAGKPAIPAKIYMGTSFIDGGDSLIFDYSCTTAKFARTARDEIRQISPCLFLGAMHRRDKCGCWHLDNFFFVELTCPDACCP